MALVLAAGFAWLAHEATERELLPGDQLTRESIQAWRDPELVPAMHVVSLVGSGQILVPLNALVAWILWRRRYRAPLLVPALTLGAVATETLLKWLVHRPRPKEVGYGFPSGHVMVSIVFFGLVLYLLWQARGGDAAACLATSVGIVVVTAIGVSRIYLNAHWLSDVLGAITAGLVFLIFAVLRLGPSLTARHDRREPRPASVRRPAHVQWLVAAGGVGLALIHVGARTLSRQEFRHMAFEMLCVVLALAGVIGRTHALRHRRTATIVYTAEAVVILALASFPAHVWVFVGGLVVAAAWTYLRWCRPALPDRPEIWVAMLLMLALPLDFLEDVLQGDPIQVDPIWGISALVGVALLTWSRLRPATA